jgi:hypothetical protein
VEETGSGHDSQAGPSEFKEIASIDFAWHAWLLLMEMMVKGVTLGYCGVLAKV